MHLKFVHKWINRSFDMLCNLLKMSHLDQNKFLDSYYDAKKKLRAICLRYESIYVCKYDYELFCKENASFEVLVYGHHWWMKKIRNGKKVPRTTQSVLIFSFKSRLLQLYSSRHTTSTMV